MPKPTVTFKIEDDILKATVEGKVFFQEALRIWEEIIEKAAAHRVRYILADCLRAEARLSTTDRYHLGQDSARHALNLGVAFKVALVGNRPGVDGFGALVAQNLGMDIAVFATVQEGLDWLK